MTTLHNTNLVGVRTLVNTFGNDISREYLFSISIPALFGSRNTTATVFCHSARIPEFSLKNKVIPFQKININLPDGINFKPWNPTFLSDDSNILRTSLLAWSSTAWDVHRKAAASPSSFKREIKVTQLNISGLPVCEYTLVGAYPETIGGYAIDNSSRNLAKFDVTFQYDYFTFVSYSKNTPTPKQVSQNGSLVNG
jgi:hypothetical protein